MTLAGIDALSGPSAAHSRQMARLFIEPGLPPGRELARMQEWPLRGYVELPAVPASARYARMHAKNMLRDWGMAALADTVELLVSELTSNAVRASTAIARERRATRPTAQGPRLRLWLASDRREVLIQMWDPDQHRPARQDPGPDAEAGRGLLLIEALSAQWGCCTRAGHEGKIVWAVCL
jgi:Histidine kinase-like ATPase domain